jgi:hypothetical protein
MDDAMKELMAIPNIGKAMARDFQLIGIDSQAEIAQSEPDDLYLRLCQATGQRQDPCVWDTFASAVHFCRTGEAKKWWDFTEDRKKRGLPDWKR